MSKYKILFIANNIKKIKKNYFTLYPILFKKNILSTFVKYKNMNNKEILGHYKYCNKLFKEILSEIKYKLNNLHKTDFTNREWNLIIGFWLRNYIQEVYKSFINLKYIQKENNFDKIYLSDYRNFNFNNSLHNAIDFSNRTTRDINWYLCLNSKIWDYFNFSNKKKIIIKQNFYYKKKNFHIFKNIKYYFFYFLGKLNLNNNAFIFKTYLPRLNEYKLKFKINRIVDFYFPIDFKKKDYNINLRNNLTLKGPDDKISIKNFIISNLFKFMPTAYIENFQTIKKITENNLFPQNTKFMLTGVLHIFDEVFKLYAALQLKKGKKLFITQHGCNYFTRIHNNFCEELKYADKFFSWGYNKKKIISIGNIKSLKTQYIPKKNGNVLIVLDFISNSTDNLYNNPDINLKKILEIKKFIQLLDTKIKKKIILRLNRDFYSKIYGIQYFRFFDDLGVIIDNGELKLDKLLLECKICIFTYESSVFYENLINGIPSIIFENRNFLNTINKSFLQKYNILRKNNILVYDKKKLARHLLHIWDNPLNWWNSKNNQQALVLFNKNLNEKPKKNFLNKLFKELN